MGLTAAWPTVVFNTSTGSDAVSGTSTASGAGPATSVVCDVKTATTTPGSTTLDVHGVIAGDMSQVLTDGSAVIYIVGIGFNRIDTVTDLTGGEWRIVMEQAVSVGAGVVCAIGGKRATLHATDSLKLFVASVADTGPVGAAGRWIIQLEDNQAPNVNIPMAYTATTAPLIIQGNSASTRQTITQTGNAKHFSWSVASYTIFRNLIFLNNNATRNEVGSSSIATSIYFENCIIGAVSGINCPKGIFKRDAGASNIYFRNSACINCTAKAIDGVNNFSMINSILTGSGAAINSLYNLGLYDSIISYNTGDGITSESSSVIVRGCTFHGNTSDGLALSIVNLLPYVVIEKNVFTNNGAYGITVTGTAPNTPYVENNAFGSGANENGTAAVNGITLSSSNITTFAPGWANSADPDQSFALPAALRGTGIVLGAGQAGNTSYLEPGAVQSKEPVKLVGMQGGVGG